MEICFLDKTIDITGVAFDSREVVPGGLFAAIKGTLSDGHNFIDSAIEKGATTIICEHLPTVLNNAVEYIEVEYSDKALAQVASKFYGEPSKHLKLVGVTGTNGKTTTATLLYDLFRRLGFGVGLISTVIYKINDKEIASSHTTPDSVKINQLLSEMVAEGCSYCFMEVSSHSVCQNRIESLQFAGALFTNITHDHLDYHHTFAHYIAAKKGLFDALPKDAFALYNGDDRNGKVMIQNCAAKGKSFGVKTMADYRCKIVESMFGGMQLSIDSKEVWVKFIGRFNAYNLLGIYATAVELGVDKDEVLRQLSLLDSVVGRFDYQISKDGVIAIVDYAHTPDALENVLSTIEEIRRPSQKIITVVGCGGDRDATKRPIMAKIAVENSDITILTSDNPRFEEPNAILADMEKGLSDIGNNSGRHITITDRAQAIATAAMMANKSDAEKLKKGIYGDIILIAGKGHENYQDSKGMKSHFDDKEEINRHLI